jgi:hypothetical protein
MLPWLLAIYYNLQSTTYCIPDALFLQNKKVTSNQRELDSSGRLYSYQNVMQAKKHWRGQFMTSVWTKPWYIKKVPWTVEYPQQPDAENEMCWRC